MDGEANHQPRQERLRTRWTASLDKIFADLVVKQIQLGNRPNNVFDKKTWNRIRDEFNVQTDLNFNNNQLRKHLDVLRTRYYNLKSAFDQNEYAMDDSCCIGFDLWEDIGPRPETIKIKDCPIYDQLCMIFTESGADGKYAQSSHYEELDDKSVGIGTVVDTHGLTSCPLSEKLSSKPLSSSKIDQENATLAEQLDKKMADRKRKRPSETGSPSGQGKEGKGINDVMAEAMLEMVAASNLRTITSMQSDGNGNGNGKYTITNCIKALDEIERIDQHIYFAALDLFEDPNSRETFISLGRNDMRLTWLLGKCGNATSR